MFVHMCVFRELSVGMPGVSEPSQWQFVFCVSEYEDIKTMAARGKAELTCQEGTNLPSIIGIREVLQ